MPGSPKNAARERLSAVNASGRRWAQPEPTAEYIGVCERTVLADGRGRSADGASSGPRIVRFDLNEVDAVMTPSDRVKWPPTGQTPRSGPRVWIRKRLPGRFARPV